MKSRLLLWALFVPFLCFANNVLPFKIEGKLTGSLNGKYAYLKISSSAYRSSQFLQVPIIDKKFSFTGNVKVAEGDMCYASLYIADKPGLTSKTIHELMVKKKEYDYRALVMEKQLKVEIMNSVKDAVVTGDELNEIYNRFYSINIREQKTGDSLWKWYADLEKKHPGEKDFLAKAYSDKLQKTYKIQDESNMERLRLIEQYPYSKISMMYLRFLVIMDAHTAGSLQEPLLEAWDKLPGSVRDSKEAKALYDSISKTGKRLSLRPGSMIPDYTFNDDQGGKVSVESFRGKYLFIDFWTSWCGPCRAEHYYMKKAYERFSSGNFSILQVSLDAKKEKWLKAVEEEKLPWQNFRMITGWDKKLEQVFAFNSVPTNYLVGPDGKIIARNLRGEELEKKLTELMGKE
jgi:thiol-disulfide isomerase/thioredoxin